MSDSISRHGVSAWLQCMGYSKLADIVMNEQRFPPTQPEPCEDCVSRKAVIRLLHSGYHSKSMIEEVKELPSVQPKHGYWTESHEHVYMGNVVKEWTNWYCSECDAPNDKPTDFCPSCGADMRGEQDG